MTIWMLKYIEPFLLAKISRKYILLPDDHFALKWSLWHCQKHHSNNSLHSGRGINYSYSKQLPSLTQAQLGFPYIIPSSS